MFCFENRPKQPVFMLPDAETRVNRLAGFFLKINPIQGENCSDTPCFQAWKKFFKNLMKKLSTIGLVIFLLSLTAQVGNAQPQAVIDCFEERSFHYNSGKYKNAEIKYRLHVPDSIRYGCKYPLLIHLHGIGEEGTNNTHQLLYFDAALPLMTGSKKQDFFMLVTQCPPDMPGWGFRSTKDSTLDVLLAISTIAHNTTATEIDTPQKRTSR